MSSVVQDRSATAERGGLFGRDQSAPKNVRDPSTLMVAVISVGGAEPQSGDAADASMMREGMLALTGPLIRGGASLIAQASAESVLAFEDVLTVPRHIDALARGARNTFACTVRAAVHLGVRVRDAGQPDGRGLGGRGVQQAREMVAVAASGEVLVSDELGAMIQLTRSDPASFLVLVRRTTQARNTWRMYRFEPIVDPSLAPTWQPSGRLPDDQTARRRLAERLADQLLAELGPVAPMLLGDLVGRAMLADEIIDGVMLYLPPTRQAHVQALIQREVAAA